MKVLVKSTYVFPVDWALLKDEGSSEKVMGVFHDVHLAEKIVRLLNEGTEGKVWRLSMCEEEER